jgi:hypothetical protein
MKLNSLTATCSLLFALLVTLGSCEKSSEAKKGTHYTKSGITMSGAQVVPTSTSNALGTMDVSYIKGTKQLNYKITWSGLSGNPTGIGVYGLAPAGYGVAPTTPFQTISITGLTANGTYSGNLLVDDVAVKEENVLNGLYYIMIRTAAFPAGEIRGQIKFQ